MQLTRECFFNLVMSIQITQLLQCSKRILAFFVLLIGVKYHANKSMAFKNYYAKVGAKQCQIRRALTRSVDLDLVFDLDLRGPVKPRWPNAGFAQWVTRQDAGLAATRPWMADRGGPTEQGLW